MAVLVAVAVAVAGDAMGSKWFLACTKQSDSNPYRPSVYVRARSSTAQHTSAQIDTARQGEKDGIGVDVRCSTRQRKEIPHDKVKRPFWSRRNNLPFIQVAVMAAAGIQRPCFAPRVV